MKKITLLITSLTALSGMAAADISGIWNTAEGDSGGYAVVEISPCTDDSQAYCGTIIDIVDNVNTSPIGRPIITGMEDRGDGRYRGGRIWAPDQDKWYNSRMVLRGDVLEVNGCVAGGLICRGQDWTRAN